MNHSLLAALQVIHSHGLEKEFVSALIDRFPTGIRDSGLFSSMDEAYVFTDASMQTDKGGCGCIIYLPDRVIRSNKMVSGPTSTFYLEYEAIFFAALKLKELNITDKRVLFFTDNKAIADQLSGRAKFKGLRTGIYVVDILNTLNGLNIDAIFNFTPRSKNNEAHRLANKARMNQIVAPVNNNLLKLSIMDPDSGQNKKTDSTALWEPQ